MYTENTSDAWHIPRYPTRKHCITSIYWIVAQKDIFLIFSFGQLKIEYVFVVFELYDSLFPRSQSLRFTRP